MNVMKPILWPPSSPFPNRGNETTKSWKILSVFLVIPFAAILHNALFYRTTCMLNPFGGAYYDVSVLLGWLSRDPSLPWAIVGATFVYHLGMRYEKVKILAAPIFVSFLPLSLWIWDIPFTGRFICHHFHDDKLLFLGHPIKSRYFVTIQLETEKSA